MLSDEHGHDVDTALPASAVGAVLAVAAGLGTYLLVPEPLFALSAGAVYAAIGYLAVALDVSLRATRRFADPRGRTGFAVGLFGLSVGGVAVAEAVEPAVGTVPFLLWYAGVLAFLLVAGRARES